MSLLANLWDAERIIIKRDARIAELEAERDELVQMLYEAISLTPEDLAEARARLPEISARGIAALKKAIAEATARKALGE